MGDTQYVAYEYTDASEFAGRRFMGSFPDEATLRDEQARLDRVDTPKTRILLVSVDAKAIRDSVAISPPL